MYLFIIWVPDGLYILSNIICHIFMKTWNYFNLANDKSMSKTLTLEAVILVEDGTV